MSALADITPGWPVVTDGSLHTVGGTSGSAPLTAAATALVAGTEKAAGRPPLGLVNGWFYAAAGRPGAFFDVVQGENDLDKVGCCTAAAGYDTASGIGVPNWATLPGTLPAPALSRRVAHHACRDRRDVPLAPITGRRAGVGAGSTPGRPPRRGGVSRYRTAPPAPPGWPAPR